MRGKIALSLLTIRSSAPNSWFVIAPSNSPRPMVTMIIVTVEARANGRMTKRSITNPSSAAAVRLTGSADQKPRSTVACRSRCTKSTSRLNPISRPVTRS